MNYKKTMLFFFFATAASVTLRTLIIFFTTESSSGFFKKEFEIFSYGMLAIIAAALFLCIIFAIKCSRPKAPAVMNRVNAVISALLGLSIAVEALFLDYSGNASLWQNLLQSLFGVLAGAVFIWLGLYFAGFLPTPGIFLALPAAFFIFRIIVVFITYSGVSTIADNVFELASLCASLILIMQFAKLQNGVNTEKLNARVLPTALAAALIILTQIIPVIIALLSGNGALVHSNILFIPTCLLMAAFALCTCVFETENVSAPKFTYTPRHGGDTGISVQDLILNDDEDEE